MRKKRTRLEVAFTENDLFLLERQAEAENIARTELVRRRALQHPGADDQRWSPADYDRLCSLVLCVRSIFLAPRSSGLLICVFVACASRPFCSPAIMRRT